MCGPPHPQHAIGFLAHAWPYGAAGAAGALLRCHPPLALGLVLLLLPTSFTLGVLLVALLLLLLLIALLLLVRLLHLLRLHQDFLHLCLECPEL